MGFCTTRCCFKAGDSAGSGPAFPFEHWRRRHKRSFVEDRDGATALATSHTRRRAQRPQRANARRRCLFNPQKLYEILRGVWLRKRDRAHNTLFSLLFRPYSPDTVWCGFTASSMAQLIAHVVGHHGGNYLLQPKLRENIQQAFFYRKERRRPSLEQWSSSLINSGRKQNSGVGTLEDAVRLLKERSSLVGKRLLMAQIRMTLDAPALIGEDPGGKLFNVNTEVDQQKVNFVPVLRINCHTFNRPFSSGVLMVLVKSSFKRDASHEIRVISVPLDESLGSVLRSVICPIENLTFINEHHLILLKLLMLLLK